VREAPAEDLPVGGATVDAVVCTLVLCSVDDPARALAEMRRVLRPGPRRERARGTGAARRAGRWQDRITPLSRRLFAGCHPNRDTVAAIRGAGFGITSLRTLADVPAAPWGRPIVAGVALAPAEA